MSGFYFPLPSCRVRINIFAPACLWVMLVSEGAASFAVILAGALTHELGHAVFVYACGQSISRVDIEPFGAVIAYTTDGLTYDGERAICGGGILFNLAAAFAASLFLGMLSVNSTEAGYLLLYIFSCVFFAFVNAVPLKHNDGGRLIYLRVLASKGEAEAEKALRVFSAVGGAILLFLGIATAYLSGFNPGLCALLLIAALPR